MRLGGAIQKSMRGIGVAASVLALTAIFSLSFGVTRYTPALSVVMEAYGSLANFAFGAVVERLADWLAGISVAWFGLRMTIGEHWKEVFTLMTLYAFADASQFVGRWVSPDPGTQRWAEFRMAATALGVGFIVSLIASVAAGLAPLDGGLVAGLALFAPAVAGFMLYAVALAWAHATWNRENSRLFSGRDEDWSTAFCWRAQAGVARGAAGLLIGLALYALADALGADSPGLLTLALLALALGGFWIYRAARRPGPQPTWRARLSRMRDDHNFDMGFDMVLKVLAGVVLAGVNANLV